MAAWYRYVARSVCGHRRDGCARARVAIRFFTWHARASAVRCSHIEFLCIFRIDWPINQLINVCNPISQFICRLSRNITRAGTNNQFALFALLPLKHAWRLVATEKWGREEFVPFNHRIVHFCKRFALVMYIRLQTTTNAMKYDCITTDWNE